MGDAGVTRPTIAVDAQVSTDTLQRTRFARHFLDVVRQVDASDGAVIGLGFLFDAVKSWESSHASRSNYRRMQRFRHWYAGDALATAGSTPPTRSRCCANKSAIWRRTTWTAPATGLPPRWRQLCGWTPRMTASPRSTPLSERRRFQWLARCCSMRAASREPQNSREPLLDADSLDEQKARWMERLRAGAGHVPLGWPGGRLVPVHAAVLGKGTRRGQRPVGRLAATALSGDPCRLASFFACLSDRPAHAHFGLKVDWDILPPASDLLPLIEQAPDFQASHSALCERVKQRAQTAAA